MHIPPIELHKYLLELNSYFVLLEVFTKGLRFRFTHVTWKSSCDLKASCHVKAKTSLGFILRCLSHGDVIVTFGLFVLEDGQRWQLAKKKAMSRVLTNKNVWKHCVEEMRLRMVIRRVDEDLSREVLG